MFTHLLILKIEPYFLYCTSEQDALITAENYTSDLVGVVSSEGLVVNELKTKVVLDVIKPKKIPKLVQIDEDTYQEVPEQEVEELPEDLQEIIDRKE